jgi:hypothetical protein
MMDQVSISSSEDGYRYRVEPESATCRSRQGCVDYYHHQERRSISPHRNYIVDQQQQQQVNEDEDDRKPPPIIYQHQHHHQQHDHCPLLQHQQQQQQQQQHTRSHLPLITENGNYSSLLHSEHTDAASSLSTTATTSIRDTSATYIDIEGQSVRLRGSRETWTAIQNDFTLPCSCVCCETLIFCIADAKFIICPICRVISCVQPEEDELEAKKNHHDGVGLGFTMEELGRWQQEILEQQHGHHRYTEY